MPKNVMMFWLVILSSPEQDLNASIRCCLYRWFLYAVQRQAKLGLTIHRVCGKGLEKSFVHTYPLYA